MPMSRNLHSTSTASMQKALMTYMQGEIVLDAVCVIFLLRKCIVFLILLVKSESFGIDLLRLHTSGP